jgi:hypothetical protein
MFLSVTLVNPTLDPLLPDELNNSAFNIDFEADWDEAGRPFY